MSRITAGFAMCGSFCTFHSVIEELKLLVGSGMKILPILSPIAYETDTRFGKAKDFTDEIEQICGEKIIHTIPGAEPIGPKRLLDVLIIAPCTGNTLGKLANGITDTSVTLAAKAHLRNARPIVIAASTNDALGAAAKNVGLLMNCKHIYFVPLKQDDCRNKPNSLVADFTKIGETTALALQERQIQPLFF